MIISYPFLGTDTADSQVNSAEAFAVDIKDYECAHGIYPVSFEQRWHGGCHLAPLQQFEPVRAIADGTIVAYRIASTPLEHDGKSHHNSFVLLKHKTETGDGRELTFYSLYMHLHCLDREISQPLRNTIIERLRTPGGDANKAAVSDGHTKVYRKDVLGFAGGMYGHRFIHFEIFMAQGDFNSYFAPTPLRTREPPPVPAGHEPDYWGDSYYLIPQGTTMLARHPKANSHHKIGDFSFPPLQGIERTTIPLLVQIRFDKGDKVTTVWHGSNIGQRISNQETSVRGEYGVRDRGFEYGMYQRALTLYPACPSAGYELLRFGHLLGPDHFPTGTPASDQENWQPVEFASGQAGYVDLSAANVKKFSDADFHSLCGWTKFEHQGTSAQVSLPALQKLLRDADSNHDAHTTPEELVAWVRRDEVRKKLRRMICLAPSEWSASNADKKFAFLKTEKGFNNSQFENFIALINKFQFWDKLPEPEINENVWHFHPLEFVAYFRKCGWLSADELSQIYQNDQYNKEFSPDPKALREQYRIHLNKVTLKYCFSDGIRLSHFLGQGAVESFRFSIMAEGSVRIIKKNVNHLSMVSEKILGNWYGSIQPQENDSYYKSKINGKISYSWFNGNCGDSDAQKFRGRGFKQLTGRGLYAYYWAYRGWLSRSDFDDFWWSDPQYKAHNLSSMKKRPATINNPQKISIDNYSTIDAGAFYLVSERPRFKLKIDTDKGIAVTTVQKTAEREIVKNATIAINGGTTDLDGRLTATREAKRILL